MPHNPSPGLFGEFVTFCASIPWENMLVRPRFEVPAPTAVAPTLAPPRALPPPTPSAIISKPGCTAADNAIVAKGHLDGLAQGLGGFGVLRVSKERLEEGAAAAQQVGHTQLAGKMRTIAQAMPVVSTPEQAKALAVQLEPVVQEAWNLGRACKGNLSPAQVSKARELARQVKNGRLSMDEAIKQVRGE